MVIVTTHPEFSDAGFSELKQLDKRLTLVAQLAPGITLCATPQVETLMHMAAEQQPSICTPPRTGANNCEPE